MSAGEKAARIIQLQDEVRLMKEEKMELHARLKAVRTRLRAHSFNLDQDLIALDGQYRIKFTKHHSSKAKFGFELQAVIGEETEKEKKQKQKQPQKKPALTEDSADVMVGASVQKLLKSKKLSATPLQPGHFVVMIGGNDVTRKPFGMIQNLLASATFPVSVIFMRSCPPVLHTMRLRHGQGVKLGEISEDKSRLQVLQGAVRQVQEEVRKVKGAQSLIMEAITTSRIPHKPTTEEVDGGQDDESDEPTAVPDESTAVPDEPTAVPAPSKGWFG
jgi:hypothetical protein